MQLIVLLALLNLVFSSPFSTQRFRFYPPGETENSSKATFQEDTHFPVVDDMKEIPSRWSAISNINQDSLVKPIPMIELSHSNGEPDKFDLKAIEEALDFLRLKKTPNDLDNMQSQKWMESRTDDKYGIPSTSRKLDSSSSCITCKGQKYCKVNEKSSMDISENFKKFNDFSSRNVMHRDDQLMESTRNSFNGRAPRSKINLRLLLKNIKPRSINLETSTVNPPNITYRGEEKKKVSVREVLMNSPNITLGSLFDMWEDKHAQVLKAARKNKEEMAEMSMILRIIERQVEMRNNKDSDKPCPPEDPTDDSEEKFLVNLNVNLDSSTEYMLDENRTKEDTLDMDKVSNFTDLFKGIKEMVKKKIDDLDDRSVHKEKRATKQLKAVKPGTEYAVSESGHLHDGRGGVLP